MGKMRVVDERKGVVGRRGEQGERQERGLRLQL